MKMPARFFIQIDKLILNVYGICISTGLRIMVKVLKKKEEEEKKAAL